MIRKTFEKVGFKVEEEKVFVGVNIENYIALHLTHKGLFNFNT